MWATILCLALSAPAVAQVIIGGAKPEVEVDRSVLDRLGAEPTLPDLLLGRRPAAQSVAVTQPPVKQGLISKPVDGRIILHRPPHKALHHTAKAKPQPNKVVVAAAAASAPVAPAEPKPAEPEKSDVVKPAEPPKTETAHPPAEAKESRIPATAEQPPPPPPQLAVTTPPPPAESAPAAAPSAPSAATAPAAPTGPTAPTPAASATAATTAPAAPTPLLPPVALPPVPALPAAEPRPAPPPALTPPPSQEARLVPPSAAGPTDETLSSILFDKDAARLPDDARSNLTRLASRMATDSNLEIQLLAYAEGDEDNASKARRLSLSRALAVRSFLIDQGVRSTRIEVRALGNKVPDGAADRVDVVVQKR